MKNLLILGASGFAGKNLYEFLKRYDNEYSIDTPSSSELNLLDEKSVVDYLTEKKYDAIINAAVCNPRRLSYNNKLSELDCDLRMYYNLEKCSELYGKMLYFGSGAEYDKRFPIVNVSEDDIARSIPTTDYGFAKYVIGRNIENSRNIYNFRIFGLFGKYENWKTTFISGACCKALKGLPITIRQNTVFDYLHIDDFCRAVKWFIDADPKYHTYNVTSGKKIDLLTIAKKVLEISGIDVPIYVCKEGYGNEYTASNERLMNESEQFLVTDIEEGIQKLLVYYESILNEVELIDLLYQ